MDLDALPKVDTYGENNVSMHQVPTQGAEQGDPPDREHHPRADMKDPYQTRPPIESQVSRGECLPRGGGRRAKYLKITGA